MLKENFLEGQSKPKEVAHLLDLRMATYIILSNLSQKQQIVAILESNFDEKHLTGRANKD